MGRKASGPNGSRTRIVGSVAYRDPATREPIFLPAFTHDTSLPHLFRLCPRSGRIGVKATLRSRSFTCRSRVGGYRSFVDPAEVASREDHQGSGEAENAGHQCACNPVREIGGELGVDEKRKIRKPAGKGDNDSREQHQRGGIANGSGTGEMS